MPREEQPSSRNKANRSHVQGQGFYLHKPSGFFDSFPEFPNIRTLYEQYQYIRPSILYKYWNNKNWLKIENKKYIYVTMWVFFGQKVNTENSTFTVWFIIWHLHFVNFVSLRAIEKKNPYMINGLDGRHCFRRVSW